MIKMDPQTEARYWQARSFYAKQLDEFWTHAYETKKQQLRAGTYSPYFRLDARPAAIWYADGEAAELQTRQWRKLEATFEGYEL